MSDEPLVPEMPDFYPRSGGPVSRWIGRMGLRLLGWKLIGDLPQERKMVWVVAPHTSNWDFFVGMCARLALGFQIHWIAKHTAFFWPFKKLLLSLGGIPVKRNSATGFAEQIAARYRDSDVMFIVITPEGTRKQVKKLKTGFLRIAEASNVPILLLGFDYPSKRMVIGDIYRPVGNIEEDERAVREYFHRFKGRHPENYCPPQ